jgi:hypothetical protein
MACKVINSCVTFLGDIERGKFAIGHYYFLAFAETNVQQIGNR